MLRKIIDRPITVTMIMLVAVVMGVVGARILPVSLIPDVDIPYMTVQINAEDMSARELDESVVRTLRHQMVQVGGLEDIVTESRDGSASIKMTFSHGTDIDYSFIEVNEKIDRTMSSLPDIERPKVLKSSATDIPAFYIDMTLRDGSAEDFTDMSRFARDVVSKRIEQLPEVAMVDVSGYVSEEIMILPDREKLAQTGLTMQDFEALVRSSDIRLGSLSIHDGQYRYNVRFVSNAASAEDIADIWFKAGDRLLQIKDVADVSVRPAKRTGLVRSDGKDALCLAVIKQSDARMADLKKGIDELMTHFEEDYPDIHFEVTRDQTELLEYSINNLIQNIVAGVLFACLVIFLFMKDLRSPTLVSLTIPVALLCSMLVFHLVGISLNVISLSGLLLGVGMMVDNTIILVDNITDRWNRCGDLRSAVLDGTKEVMGPMLSSVLTTCVVFVPLVFTGGIAGALFYDQAMAVSIVLLSSYLVTVTVIPVYYLWWYRKLPSFRPNPLLERISFDGWLHRGDERILSWFLDHRWMAWVILAVSSVGMTLCLAFMRKEKFPEMTYTETVMTVDWNDHISVDENVRRTSMIESSVDGKALHVTSLVGMQQFVLSHSGDLSISESSVYMKFPDQKVMEESKVMLAEMLAAAFPEASLRFDVSGNIFDMVFGGSESPLIARLRPVSRPELETSLLKEAVEDIREALPASSVAEVPVKADVVFVADPEMMALYDVSYQQLILVLRNALNENSLFDIVQGSRTLPVVTGNDSGSLAGILSETAIEHEYGRIPVSLLMRQTYMEDLKSVISGAEGNFYPVRLDVSSDKVPHAMNAIDEVLREKGDFEAGYSGSFFSNRKMVVEMCFILLLALLLLYLILASQFESLLQPVIILSEVVIDVFVSLLVLYMLDLSINLMSLIGLVVISGIVINDSILKIDTINRLRREGLPVREAIMSAGRRRLKAIIMTSLTTILSVLPFLSRGNMGDDLQYPLSIVIIAGMSIGTFVSLFVLPALYHSLYRDGKDE